MSSEAEKRSDTGSVPKTSKLEDAYTPDRIDPAKVRVVDVEAKNTGEIIHRDCYDPDGGPAEMGDVMTLKDGELWLRVISWARSKSHSDELTLKWESTGLSSDEVGRIGVFKWPTGKAVRVFGDKKDRHKKLPSEDDRSSD
jgi:ribosomal protein S28E/S33